MYLKCRYAAGKDGKLAIQVYHHHKEADSVHHCKLYEGKEVNARGGFTNIRECHCFCTPSSNSTPTTQRRLMQLRSPSAQAHSKYL